jgi:hypothetical protein
MTQKETEPSVVATKRDLDKASAALQEPGAGAIGNLECRVSDLRVRLISTPATTLADIEARLDVIRTLVASLGPAGYLLNVVDATLEDVRSMRTRGEDPPPPRS